jgi:hypothetical protein
MEAKLREEVRMDEETVRMNEGAARKAERTQRKLAHARLSGARQPK